MKRKAFLCAVSAILLVGCGSSDAAKDAYDPNAEVGYEMDYADFHEEALNVESDPYSRCEVSVYDEGSEAKYTYSKHRGGYGEYAIAMDSLSEESLAESVRDYLAFNAEFDCRFYKNDTNGVYTVFVGAYAYNVKAGTGGVGMAAPAVDRIKKDKYVFNRFGLILFYSSEATVSNSTTGNVASSSKYRYECAYYS